ncbi:hypothetical protein BHE74_00046705 [Ensete ventricosum]|nr:hypothetical protein GW17_00036534 [Ensete ventricosum]RWW47320.1 hypothetical protein BHE74_00046705 [Ensete ventricosum]
MIRATGELDCFNAHIRLREPGKSEDKVEWIYRSRRKGRRCKATDSKAMGGLATQWYRKGGTTVELSIPSSHGGRALVVKGTEEVENAEANSKYQDRADGQRPRNFIRPMASAALLKSSFLPRRSEWHTIRKSSTPQSTVVAFSVRAGAYSDELVKTAVCTS